MLKKSLITVCLLFAATSMAVGQQSSRADFNEHLELMEGRWVGEVTWIADWPGVGKRGDRATCYADLKILADGNVLFGTFYGGSGTSSWMTVYDAASNQIKMREANSGGTTWDSVWYRDGGNWILTGTGRNADGSKIEFKHTLTITNGGNTHTYTGTTTIGGKPVDERHDVWRRVSK